MNLAGKSALVTGCSSGVGLHTAVGLARAGARVYRLQTQRRGAFESNAQTPEQVAAVIVQSLQDDNAPLRTLSSDAARAFAAEKLAGDPNGMLLQARIRAELLGR